MEPKADLGFAAAMVASFPAGLQPPEPLVRFFEWQEANDLVSLENGHFYGRRDPDRPYFYMFTTLVNPSFAETWYDRTDPVLRERLAAFLRTGGDGSYAGLWRDDAGELAFVHMGSGSGSTMQCILTRDPVDFLRLLAIGYDELCWPEYYAQRPEDIELDEEDDPYEHRSTMRAWVEATFGVVVPDRASEIVGQTADMDAAASSDAFWNWYRPV